MPSADDLAQALRFLPEEFVGIASAATAAMLTYSDVHAVSHQPGPPPPPGRGPSAHAAQRTGLMQELVKTAINVPAVQVRHPRTVRVHCLPTCPLVRVCLHACRSAAPQLLVPVCMLSVATRPRSLYTPLWWPA